MPVTDVTALHKVPYQAPARGFDLRLEITGDRGTIPVPAYGSQSSGFYRVVALWDRISEARLRKLVVDEKDQRPILIFYFGTISWAQRLEYARAARRTFGQQQFLLVDETLFTFLLTLPEERAISLFNIALAFSTTQPYSTTSGIVPREMFFGRNRDMQQLMDRNGPNLLYGGRQLGKTALLRQIQAVWDSVDEGRLVRYIDLHESGVGLYRPTSEVFGTIAKRLKDIGFRDGRNTSEREVLNFISTWLAQDERRRIVLLLDESDDFLKQDSYERFKVSKKLKALMDSTQRRFKLVFSGLHNVLRTTVQENHPLAHLGQPINIGPLMNNGEEEDALNMIRVPLASLGFEVPVDIAFNILAQTNYYPSLLQIYGKYLTETLYQQKNTQIPMQVDQQVVDDAFYFKPDLAESIRRNFRLTLQLDQRYEFIAYVIALSYVEHELDLQKGMSSTDIREKGVQWWPVAFEQMGFDELSALLDEMVGLGVLRHLGSERYTFRTLNVLPLMGSNAQIEEMIVKTRELEIQFDPAAFREKLQGQNDWSPVTEMQKKALTTRDQRVIMVTGSRALGIMDLERALASVESAHVTTSANCNNEHDFKTALSRFLSDINGAEGYHFLIVPPQLLWDATWVAAALNRVERRSSQTVFVKIVFLADATRIYDLIKARMWNRVVALRPQIVSLERWRDSAVRQMIEDLNLDADRDARARLRDLTGYMPSLLKAFAQASNNAVRLSTASTSMLFSEKLWPSRYIEDAGIPSADDAMTELLSCLAITDGGSAESALAGMTSSYELDDVTLWMEYFRLLRLVSIEGEKVTVFADVKAALGL